MYVKISYTLELENEETTTDFDKIKNELSNKQYYYVPDELQLSLSPGEQFYTRRNRKLITIDLNFIYETITVEVESGLTDKVFTIRYR